jgi:hypothetical protein
MEDISSILAFIDFGILEIDNLQKEINDSSEDLLKKLEIIINKFNSRDLSRIAIKIKYLNDKNTILNNKKIKVFIEETNNYIQNIKDNFNKKVKDFKIEEENKARQEKFKNLCEELSKKISLFDDSCHMLNEDQDLDDLYRYMKMKTSYINTLVVEIKKLYENQTGELSEEDIENLKKIDHIEDNLKNSLKEEEITKKKELEAKYLSKEEELFEKLSKNISLFNRVHSMLKKNKIYYYRHLYKINILVTEIKKLSEEEIDNLKKINIINKLTAEIKKLSEEDIDNSRKIDDIKNNLKIKFPNIQLYENSGRNEVVYAILNKE